MFDPHVADLTWLEALRDGRLTEKVWMNAEVRYARFRIRRFRRRGEHTRAAAWAFKHYGKNGGQALLHSA